MDHTRTAHRRTRFHVGHVALIAVFEAKRAYFSCATVAEILWGAHTSKLACWLGALKQFALRQFVGGGFRRERHGLRGSSQGAPSPRDTGPAVRGSRAPRALTRWVQCRVSLAGVFCRIRLTLSEAPWRGLRQLRTHPNARSIDFLSKTPPRAAHAGQRGSALFEHRRLSRAAKTPML